VRHAGFIREIAVSVAHPEGDLYPG
jgi:hypothetical protein